MKTHQQLLSLALTSLVALTGCDSDPSTDPQTRQATELPAHVDTSRTAAETVRAIQELTPRDDWRAWVRDETERLRQDAPEQAATLAALQPRRNRARMLQFAGPLVRNETAGAVFLDRLVNGNEPSDIRVALAEAMPRTGADFSPAFAELFASETDSAVRGAMIESLRTARAPYALDLLRAGFNDPQPAVRAQAARIAGRRSDGAQLSAELVAALHDTHGEVKAQAAQAAGIHKLASAKPSLTRLLHDTQADARLQSLLALRAIDPTYTQRLPEATELQADPDPRVARTATMLKR